MNTKRSILSISNKYFKQQNSLGRNLLPTRNVEVRKTVCIALPNSLQFVANKIGHISPQHMKDINGHFIMSQRNGKIVSILQIRSKSYFDSRVDLSLSSSMTTISSPFNSEGKSMHLNMTGEQWDQQNKFISNFMQRSHYTNYSKKDIRSYHTLTNRLQNESILLNRSESTSTNNKETKLSRKDMLKRAVKDYGSTVIVFHVGISLISLGTCYLLVTSGIDMGKLLMPLGISGTVAANTGAFVTAYAIHKVFAPVRISITLAATPFIVRYLRQIGFLKKPKV